MISQKTIQDVLSIASVEDIVQDYVSLKRRGANMLGLCPFHDEKTPSFTVSPSKNIYKCFGCGKGGGPVQFVMEHDQMSFPEAIRALASKYNITVEQDNKEDQAKYEALKKVEESYHLINAFANEYFRSNLRDNDEGKRIGLSYFKERGFLMSTIDKFDLGYAVKKRDALVEAATEKHYNTDFLKELGLMNSRGSDFFRDRVMFPIHSVSGKVIAFAGRTLSKEKSQPKYINSPETAIYNKRKVLYGIHLAKGSIRKLDNCFIVEGYTDVISLSQNGVENVVASSGTALTSGQLRLLKRFTDNVTFLYDGDAAGVKAAMRGLDLALENDMNVSLVLLPEGEDPDSFIRGKGNNGFVSFVEEHAKDFIFFKMDLLLKESNDDPIKKASVIKDIIKSIAKLRDPIKRSLYIKQCGQVLQVSEPILVKEVNKVIKTEIKQKKIDADRAQRRAQVSSEKSPASQRDDFPDEEYPGAADVDSYDHYPEERIQHDQTNFRQFTHEFQEKDLARIVINSGDMRLHDLYIEKTDEWKNDEEADVMIAELIYNEVFDIRDFFDNPVYRDIIDLAFQYVERGNSELPIKDYFINHQDAHIRQVAVDVLSSKYEFANWVGKGVHLNQKMPEKNFKEDSRKALLMFKFKKLSKVMDSLSDRIQSEELADTKEALLKAFLEMQKQRLELSQQLGVVIPPK